MSWVVCILSIFLPIPQEVDYAIDCIYLMFSACLQSQQEHELDLRRMEEGSGPIPGPSHNNN
eukprot:Awhi_evm2s14235